MADNEDWCKRVSSFVLGKKKRKWEHYKDEWLADAFPLDEIGITFFARCFKWHICVFVNCHYWTTHKDNVIEQCSIFLAFRGRMSFDDTRPMTAAEFSASSEAIGRIQAKFDEEKLREENAMKLRKRTSHKRPHISSDEEDIDLEQLLEDSAKDKPKPASNINNMQKLTKPCIVSVQRINDTLKDELTKFSSDKQTVTLVETQYKGHVFIL